MNEIIHNISGIDICSESFGEKNNPAILLIMGASASMIWWDSEFCRILSEKGYFVIRFDNRDVGRSTFYESGKPQYNLIDMANDAIGVLDNYGIKKAHFIGMSLGGMIAQIAALKYKERLLSLILISSSLFGPGNTDLPPISKKITDYHVSAGEINWGDKIAVIKYMAEGGGLLSGSNYPFDRESAYRLAELEYERAENLMSMFNHALLTGGEEYYGRINEITISTLIIHGTEDPVLPYKHALALNEEIQESELITLLGRGHELHKNDWQLFIKIIDSFCKKNAG
jgi:pimeloyl-ACP methyl ester carboxylesterase